MYYLPQELHVERKIHKGMVWNDVLFFCGGIAIIGLFKSFVHEPLVPAYYVFNVIMSLFLIARSPFNPKKRMMFSLFCYLKKDKHVYHSSRTVQDATIENVNTQEEEYE